LDGEAPRAAFLGIAGRVSSPVVTMTNAPWTVDASGIGTAFRLEQVVLVNDYVPVAALLPSLGPERPVELAVLGRPLPGRDGVRIALGPGTGLGAAACIPTQDCYWLHPTEAGHVSFGACEDEEFALWPLLERVGGRITAETLLSGPGLVRLYRALSLRRAESPTGSSPADIVAQAQADSRSTAGQTLHLFLALLGRYAGDLGLVFGATGGVFFGSGILP
jgi:glucokinase